MPKLLWTMACKRLLVDRATNEASLLDIYEEIRAPALMVQMPLHFVVVSLWEREEPGTEPEEFDWQLVQTWQEDGQAKEEILNEAKLEIPRQRVRASFDIFGLTIHAAGSLAVQNKWRKDSGAFQDAGDPIILKVTLADIG